MTAASVRKQQPKAAVVRKQQPKAAAVRKQQPKAAAVRKQQPKAAVLGGSISGLMASLVLNNKGFAVTLYEKRPDYNRNIQWTCRQSFIDYLSSIDEKIAKEFYTLVSPITNGFRLLSDKTVRYPNGAYNHRKMAGKQPGNPDSDELDKSCEDAFRVLPVGLVRTQQFEKFLLKKVQARRNITTHLKEAKCR